MRQGDAFFSACPLPFPTTEWRAWGIRATDGDTIVVKLDRGFLDEATMELRLDSIDCWERNSGTHRDQGERARIFSDALVANHWLTVRTKMDPEKYGRILANVLVPFGAGYTDMRDLATLLDAAGYRKVVA